MKLLESLMPPRGICMDNLEKSAATILLQIEKNKLFEKNKSSSIYNMEDSLEK